MLSMSLMREYDARVNKTVIFPENPLKIPTKRFKIRSLQPKPESNSRSARKPHKGFLRCLFRLWEPLHALPDANGHLKSREI